MAQTGQCTLNVNIATSFVDGPWNEAALDQEGFRFFDDDADEDESTGLAAQDGNITRAKALNTRPRILLDATGNPATTQYELRYKETGDGDVEYRKVKLT